MIAPRSGENTTSPSADTVASMSRLIPAPAVPICVGQLRSSIGIQPRHRVPLRFTAPPIEDDMTAPVGFIEAGSLNASSMHHSSKGPATQIYGYSSSGTRVFSSRPEPSEFWLREGTG